MASRSCASCTTRIPVTNYCPDCGELNPDVAIPAQTTDPEVLTTHLSKIAGEADHETVSFDALRSDYEKYDRPLGDYLFDREQPVAIFESTGTLVEHATGTTWKIKTGFRKSGHLVFTDERLFVLLPKDDSDGIIPDGSDSDTDDQIVSVDYDSIVAVERDSGWRKDRLQLETDDGYTYNIGLSGVTDEELVDTFEIVQEFSREGDADPTAIRFIRDAELIRDIDDTVAESETAEDLLRTVADLLADRNEATRFDSAVAEADSLDELSVALQSSTGIVTDSGNGRNVQSQDKLLPTKPQVGGLRNNVSETLQNADPAEVGKYALAAGLGFGGWAISAPFSTVAVLAAIATGGAATGAYASTHPNSLAARIDPITIATRARIQGNKWRNSSIPGNGGAGAVLGALEYIAEEEIPPEYAHWIASTDLNRIQQGAELGAQAAERYEDIDNAVSAAALGGGLGLAHGFIDDANQVDDLENLLDDDLYEAIDLQELDEGSSDEFADEKLGE